jgi:PIN domain nuclease of toxin-antitoxin system
MLIAQAAEEEMKLVSHDDMVALYGDTVMHV